MCKRSGKTNIVVGEFGIDRNADSGRVDSLLVIAEQKVGLGHRVLPHRREAVARTKAESPLQHGQRATWLTVSNIQGTQPKISGRKVRIELDASRDQVSCSGMVGMCSPDRVSEH